MSILTEITGQNRIIRFIKPDEVEVLSYKNIKVFYKGCIYKMKLDNVSGVRVYLRGGPGYLSNKYSFVN